MIGGWGLVRDPRTDTYVTVAEYVARNRRESVARETVAEVVTIWQAGAPC